MAWWAVAVGDGQHWRYTGEEAAALDTRREREWCRTVSLLALSTWYLDFITQAAVAFAPHTHMIVQASTKFSSKTCRNPQGLSHHKSGSTCAASCWGRPPILSFL